MGRLLILNATAENKESCEFRNCFQWIMLVAPKTLEVIVQLDNVSSH